MIDHRYRGSTSPNAPSPSRFCEKGKRPFAKTTSQRMTLTTNTTRRETIACGAPTIEIEASRRRSRSSARLSVVAPTPVLPPPSSDAFICAIRRALRAARLNCTTPASAPLKPALPRAAPMTMPRGSIASTYRARRTGCRRHTVRARLGTTIRGTECHSKWALGSRAAWKNTCDIRQSCLLDNKSRAGVASNWGQWRQQKCGLSPPSNDRLPS